MVKAFIMLDLLPILVGIICLIVIYAGSGVYIIKSDEEAKDILLRNPQKILSPPEKDPLIVDALKLRHIKDMFDTTVYLLEDKPGHGKVTQPIVEEYMMQNPLRIVIGTDAILENKSQSITRTLKGFSYYNKNSE